jgi:CheY-like chemotaxis protein
MVLWSGISLRATPSARAGAATAIPSASTRWNDLFGMLIGAASVTPVDPGAHPDDRWSVANVPAPSVLVVDDSQDNREMYADYLRFHGVHVVEASTGLEAVEKARELVPEVILMDLSLPEIDGWEATRRIKAAAETAHVRVIALTGHTGPGLERDARAAGCDDFLTKPCDPNELLARIRAQRELAGKVERERRSTTGLGVELDPTAEQ